MVEFTLLDKSDFQKGGRRKRGGVDPDQAPVVSPTLEIDLPAVQVEADDKLKTPLRNLVMGAIKKSVEVMHAALTSEAAKNTAILGITVAASSAALNMADQYYGKDICSPAMAQLAASLAGVGLTGNRDKCDVALKAYNDTFALLKPLVISAVGAATGRLVGIKINIGEGFITNTMNKVISSMQATPDVPAEGALAPAAKAKKGGRTKRHGMKKKGSKSRKHRR